MDAVNAFCGLLTARCVENGIAPTAALLAQELPELSRYGSRDDVSIAAPRQV